MGNGKIIPQVQNMGTIQQSDLPNSIHQSILRNEKKKGSIPTIQGQNTVTRGTRQQKRKTAQSTRFNTLIETQPMPIDHDYDSIENSVEDMNIDKYNNTYQLTNGQNTNNGTNQITMPMKQPSRKNMIPSKQSIRNNYRGVQTSLSGANNSLGGAQTIYNRGSKIPQHQGGSKSISGPQEN